MFGITARNTTTKCTRYGRSLTPPAIRLYSTERHSSLAAKVWVLTNGDPVDTLKMTRVATALGIPFEIKHAVSTGTWLSEAVRRPFRSIRALLSKTHTPSGTLQHIQGALATDLPRIAIAGSEEALPGLLETKAVSCGQTMAVYLGYPNTKLSNIDALVLSRLDQMRLRTLGPGRAVLENATSTLLPFSGGLAPTDAPANTTDTLAVCIGRGMEPAGFRLFTRDVDALAEGLLRIPARVRVLLPRTIHKGIKRMINTRLLSRIQAADSLGSVEILDYALGSHHPSPADVIASASHVIATADNVSMVALAVALQRPVYIAGEERTTDILRSYYHTLETRNLVRRFYPRGSKYDYMLMADIDGEVDKLSIIRSHDPWAKYDAQADLGAIASFIQQRYKQSRL